jgi:serine/threonine protein kinase
MEQRTASCPSCRREIFAEDAFCSWCGSRVQTRDAGTGDARRSLVRRTIPTGERVACGSCNSPVLPGDLFCSTCGARHGAEDADPGFGDSWTSIPFRVAESTGGKYEFVRELGRGGMGIVFMARDRELDRLVAVKVLSPAWLTDDAMVRRFQREARTIASLRHESIVSVYDVGRAGDLHYFVMDFIEGVSLSRILRLHGPLSIPAVLAILYRVGLALSYAHRPGRGIVHRDIKPSNIMLDAEGLAIVMDFGISKASETPSGLTRTGLVMGTPEYMSPEQCRGHTVTHESDQYSLGCVAYAMLTGAPPFTGPFYQVLMAHQTEPVPPIQEARPDCPPELAAAVERMLAKLPGDRWPDIVDAIKALGLRPLAPDDPAVEEIGRLVRRAADAGRQPEPGDGRDETHRTPTSIRIMPHPDDLEVGDQVSLVATVLFPDGAEEPPDELLWESTDPHIARVDPATGRLVALGAGSALITAVGGGLRESLAVEVRPPQVAQIDIEPADVEIEVGATARLRARPHNKRGEALERAVSWSSSDPRTASVSSEGVVTARRDGAVTILAHCEGVGAATVVRVVGARGDTASRGTGPSTAASALGGASPDAPGRPAAPDPWAAGARTSSPAAPWEITPRPGRGSAAGAAGSAPPSTPGSGSSVVPPGRAGGPDRFAPDAPRAARAAHPVPRPAAGRPAWTRPLLLGAPVVLVAVAAVVWLVRGGPGPEPPPPVTEVTILTAEGAAVGDPLRVLPGDTVRLAATASDAAGAIVDRPVTWSSSDAAVASIDAGGVLVALGRGSARITARAEEASREVAVTVEAVPPAEIVLRTAADGRPVDELELAVGQWILLGAGVLDRSGRVLDGRTVAWTSSSTSVASVDAEGRVTGRAAGRAVITARAGTVSRDLPVEVTRPVDPEPPPPANGRLVLRIVPSWANVTLDGVSRGEQTGLDLRLAPGRHRLRLENPRMMPIDTTFVVEPGARVELNIRMRERNER